LRDIRRTEVQQLVDRLGAEHLSESRIRSVVSALRALYGYAIEQGQVEFNPADGLVMPRGDEPVQSRLDEPWDDPPAWEDRPQRTRPPEVSDRAPRATRSRPT
jgi:site-specific recombinase XerC